MGLLKQIIIMDESEDNKVIRLDGYRRCAWEGVNKHISSNLNSDYFPERRFNCSITDCETRYVTVKKEFVDSSIYNIKGVCVLTGAYDREGEYLGNLQVCEEFLRGEMPSGD